MTDRVENEEQEYENSSQKGVPTSLRIVAGLFCLGGFISLLEVVVAAINGTFSINIGILGMFIGPGLLRYKRVWHLTAILFILIYLIAIPLIEFWLLKEKLGPFRLMIFNQNVVQVSRMVGLAVNAIFLLLFLWMFRVLVHPDIRKLFKNDE